MADVKPGDVLLGKYRVERVLGVGGMGVVVAATHLQLEERVALKFMLPRAMQSPEGATRFLQEARAAVKLKGEHVARVHDVGTLESGAPYIAMEYLEGEDLSRVLAARGPLPVEEVANYVLQACDAIAEAHARGIVHRDLKPANLFITQGPDGQPLVKVLDFGISKANALGDSHVSMTSSTVLLGSPLYMSPEQMKSARDVGPSSDQWSLGVLLYEALTGRVPYDASTLGALMEQVLTMSPPPLRSLRNDVPERLAAIVARCLEKDPSRRFASVADLARALAPFAPPRMLTLADRITSVLRASRPAPALGLDATMSDDPSAAGRLLAHAEDRPEPGVPPAAGSAQTAGSWGGTAPGHSSRRRAIVGGVAAVLLAGLATAVFMARRPGPGPALPSRVSAIGPASAPSAAPPAPRASSPAVVSTPPSLLAADAGVHEAEDGGAVVPAKPTSHPRSPKPAPPHDPFPGRY